jgi:hypothetical protein
MLATNLIWSNLTTATSPQGYGSLINQIHDSLTTKKHCSCLDNQGIDNTPNN